MKKYWLMKSEPDVYSIDDLAKDKATLWEGVRNYQARNFMMKDMQVGDEVLFYHSNAEPPGIAGIAKIKATSVPDPSQFDKKSEYYDPKANVLKPIWFCAEVQFIKKFRSFVTLANIKTQSALNDMLVIKKGQRLSIQPVSAANFLFVKELAK